MEEKQIKTTFAKDSKEEFVKNFLESENMKIHKIQLFPVEDNPQWEMGANITAFVREGKSLKTRKFTAYYNSSNFRLIMHPISDKFNHFDLNREWQRFLLKHFGKEYLEYHEHRTDAEIETLNTQLKEIESNKDLSRGLRLSDNYEKIARKIMQLKYERTF